MLNSVTALLYDLFPFLFLLISVVQGSRQRRLYRSKESTGAMCIRHRPFSAPENRKEYPIRHGSFGVLKKKKNDKTTWMHVDPNGAMTPKCLSGFFLAKWLVTRVSHLGDAAQADLGRQAAVPIAALDHMR